MWIEKNYILVCLICISVFVLLPAEAAAPTYRAGVVEFAVNIEADLNLYLERNTRRYLQLISEAADNNVDILVFPESTLNNVFTGDRSRVLKYAVSVDLNTSPCDTDSPHKILKAISCAARDGHLYVVINVSERLPCDEGTQNAFADQRPCHADGFYLFNSNVVFNRNGIIVSRYRKTHLFGEFAFNTTEIPEVESFTTDFGVTFGHLICFDLQYESPAQVLLESRRVDNFVLSLMWYSELPFLTAVQFQSAWAYSHGVNLLAAGASAPSAGSGGSGIFAGREGDRASLMSGEAVTRLLIADVHKTPSLANYSDPQKQHSISPRRMSMLRDHLHLYSIKFLETDSLVGGGTDQICYLDFCCFFNITISFYGSASSPAEPHYEYALVAFRGVRTYSDLGQGGVENCGVVACTSKNQSDCGLRFPASTQYSPHVVFENITLKGDFTNERSVQYPTALTGDIMPLKTNQFSLNTSAEGNSRRLTLKLEKRQADLLTFGVFSRVFSMDCDPLTEDHRVVGVKSNGCNFVTNSSDDFENLLSKFAIPLLLIAIYALEML